MSIRKQDRPNTVSQITQNARKDDAKALIRQALSLVKIPVSTIETICMTYRIKRLRILPPKLLYTLHTILKGISDYFLKRNQAIGVC
jgi:hypothetical protein